MPESADATRACLVPVLTELAAVAAAVRPDQLAAATPGWAWDVSTLWDHSRPVALHPSSPRATGGRASGLRPRDLFPRPPIPSAACLP